MRWPVRQHPTAEPVHSRWLLVCLFWVFLTLLAATLTQSQVEPQPPESILSRLHRDPSLTVARVLEPVAELSRSERDAVAPRLGELGVDPQDAFVDRRSGRWGTLLVTEPLLPGRGVANDLRWPEYGHGPADRGGWQRAAWQAFEAWLQRQAAALQLDPTELALPARVTVHDGGRLIQIHVGRRIEEVPVRDDSITAVINHGNLVLFGFHGWGDVRVDRRPRISAMAARQTVARHLEGLRLRAPLQEAELVLVPTAAVADPRTVSLGEGYAYRLVWVLRARLMGSPGVWEALVDAQRGELLAFTDRASYASTRQVMGGVYPVSNDGQPPDGVEQPFYPMPYADLTTASGTLYTDGGGNYPVCVDGQVSTTLNGRYIRIEDFCGPLAESSLGDIDLATSGGLDCQVPVGSDSPGNTHSARTAFYELNRMAEQARSHLPGNEWLEQQLTAVLNIPDFGYPEFNCNAFWDESTVNFFTAGALPQNGPECTNTGELAGVLDHEWGHGLDNNDNVPFISNPGEGIADVYAALRLNDSCIARGFYTGQNYCGDNDPCLSCDGVRDIDWMQRQSGVPHDLGFIDDADNCPGSILGDVGPCGGSIHCEGAVYSEAVWDLVHRELQASPFDMDLNTALEVGTRLTYLGAGNVQTWYTCANDGLGTGDGCNADGGYLNYLAADDDNGDLTDGTPHMSAIAAAFDSHGIACDSPDPTPQNSGCSDRPTQAAVVTATPLDRAIRLSWTSVPGASSYRVFRTDGVFGCDFGKILLAETTDTEWLDEGLQNETAAIQPAYSYTVIPMGAAASCFGPASACTTVAPVAGANLGIDPASVDLQPLNGDLDPFIDNCEEAQVVFAVANTGTGAISEVQLLDVEVLSPVAGVTITSPLPQTLAPSLAACAEASGSFTFRAEGLDFGDQLTLRVEVTAQELAGRVKSHLIRLTGAESSLESHVSRTFSFETGREGWQTSSGTFARTDAGGGAEGSAFYMASSSNLPDQCDAIRSPTLRLTPSSTLEMSTQVDIEPSLDIDGTTFWFDRANVGVTRVSTGERRPVEPDGGRLYNAGDLYGTCGTQNQEGWADSMPSWAASTWSAAALESADLAGDFVFVDVRYGTDAELEGFGLRFDEVTVTDFDLVVEDTVADQCIPGNLSPVVVDDAATTTGPVVLDVLANDSDPDMGDSLRIIGVTQPAGGTVQINAVGPNQDTLTYTPVAGPGRIDTFQYAVGDGRGGSASGTVTVDFDVILYDDFELGTSEVWSSSVGETCDPDGVYDLITPAVQYSCCTLLGPPQVDIDITRFEFAADGSLITPSTMHAPVTLTGSGAVCPSGNFVNSDVLTGGCTETYTLDGTFLDEDTWSGTLEMSFDGLDCDCLGADPCLDQSFPVTAVRP